jgi:hypothetical protein
MWLSEWGEDLAFVIVPGLSHFSRAPVAAEWISTLSFVFRRPWVQISARKLTEVFRLFVCPFIKMCESYLKLGYDLLLSYPFQFIIY